MMARGKLLRQPGRIRVKELLRDAFLCDVFHMIMEAALKGKKNL